MITIKELQMKDLDLFFNTNEVAELVMINDKEVSVVLDSERLKELQIKMGEGIHRAEVLFSVKKSDLPGKPAVGKTMKYGKHTYKILDCIDEGLTWKVTLGANRS